MGGPDRLGTFRVEPEVMRIPPLTKWESWLCESYARLSTQRRIGMGVGPIPYRDIREYMDGHPLTQDERYRFEYAIRQADSYELKQNQDEAESKVKTPGP